MKKKEIDLIILCGGKGTRLGKLTKKIPKPLIKFNNIPFLDYLINYYKKYPINKIYLLAGYRGEEIFKRYHNKKFNFIDCEVVIEKKPLGTAGCLIQLKQKLSKNFMVINGDSFVNYDFGKIIQNENFKKNKVLLVKNHNYKSNRKLSTLSIKNKKITYSKNSKKNLMNAGIYFFNRKIFQYIKDKKFISLEEDIIPKLIKNNKLEGFEIKTREFLDIGTIKNYKKGKKFLKKIFYKPALFLDRDGVINRDKGYVYKINDFEFNNDIFNIIKKYRKNNFNVFIVTNQSGIGRGYYEVNDFNYLHAKLKKIFCQKEAFIDDVIYCPHHPKYAKKKYKINCNCRKPKNGMLESLIKQWLINRSRSIFYGDKISDELAANKSDIKFRYYKF